MCPEPLVIAGDFNFHMDLVHSKDAVTFNELLETFGLSQHVSVPTHIFGHILDLIITQSTNDLIFFLLSVLFASQVHVISEVKEYRH